MNDSYAFVEGVVRLVRDDLHVFHRLGRDFAVHKPSGEFFALDDLGLCAVDVLKTAGPDEAREKVQALYGADAFDQILMDFSALLEAVEKEETCDEVGEPIVEMTDLTLNLVNRCNLACVYCWNEKGSYGGEAKGPMMSAETARKGVDLLLKHSEGVDSLVVDFYGGEPLLNLPVMKSTVEYCQEISRKKNIRFSFLLATNGLLLTQDTANWLHEAGINVALSLDGDKSVQDAQRPLPGGGGSFDTVWKNLQALPAHIRDNYVARATLTPSGPGAMGTYRMLHDLGFTRIEVFESEAACFGMPMEHADLFYIERSDRQRLMKEYEELLLHMIDQVAEGRIQYRDLFFTRLFKQMARLVRNGDFEGPCAAGLGQIAVDTEGYVYPCTAFIGAPEWRMGHVDDRLDAGVQDQIRNCDISCSQSCKNCWAHDLCLGSGSCFNLNHFNHKDISKPVEEHCEMYRFKVELLIAGLATLQDKNPERFEELFAPGHFEDRTAWSPSGGD